MSNGADEETETEVWVGGVIEVRGRTNGSLQKTGPF